MIEATVLFNRHRECVRSIWNTYFCRVADEQDERDLSADADARLWDERDLFADAEARLFEAQILLPLGRYDGQYRPDYMSPRRVMNFIQIVPATSAQLLVNREIECGYWDWGHPLPKAEDGDFDLRMIHFFDWDLLGRRNYEYVRVVISESNRYPEAKGKHALVKTDDVRFLCEEPKR